VLHRYAVEGSDGQIDAELLPLLLEVELTFDEFTRGLCQLAMLHHRAPAPAAALPAERAAGVEAPSESAGVVDAPAAASEVEADPTEAPGSPPAPTADAPLPQVYEHFLQWVLAPRVAEYRLQLQLAAMEI
jgi:hypothetical protein